jgi:cobalt-zinc-cadmium efflux system membrane fusion protein
MRSSYVRAFGAAALILALAASAALGHEGHDHGPQPLPPAEAAPRGEATSSSFELVAVARGTELVVYLDRFETNEPITGAGIEVETPDGPATASASGDVYRIAAPWLAKGGRVDLIFTVTAGASVDILPHTLARRGEAAAAADANANWWAGALSLGGAPTPVQPLLLVGALSGFLLGIMFMVLKRGRLVAVVLLSAGTIALTGRPGLAHEGEAHPEPKPGPSAHWNERAQRLPDRAVFVPKSIQRIFGLRTSLVQRETYRRSIELPGRIIPDPNASGYVQAAVGGRLSPAPGGFPRLGTRVKQGDVLAYVTPPMQAIDVSDMRQRQGELDQQISIVERRLRRYETLAPSGAVARSQLEDTKLELDGLRERRASLEAVRREPEALLAPVSGVIAEGTPVAGQIAQPNAVVFHIVDPAKLWVEALSFDAMVDVDIASAATANGRVLSLAFRGSGFADRSQSIPVHFAIGGDVSGLRAGQFLTVFVTTDDRKQGLAIPRTGLVRGANGQDFVYEHVAAERFEPRPVRAEPLDGDRVLVEAGIGPGKRIVVQGAELLDHVR